MARLVSPGINLFSHWIGKTWVCPETGNTWAVDAEDLKKLTTIGIGLPYNPDYVDAIPCPCGRGHVYMASEQREGNHLVHR